MSILADIYYHLYEGGDTTFPPIVLLHGIGGTHLDWLPDIRRLSGFRVYAVDLPGHGRSRKHGYQSVHGYADSLLAWLDAVGLYRAVFVGHSLGSSIALHLGSFHPERVAGLVAIANEGRSAISATVMEDAAHDSTYLRGMQQLLEKCFHPDTDSCRSRWAIQRLLENRPSVVYGDLLACNAFKLNGELSLVSAPTLLICGDDDKLTPLRHSQYLAKEISNAQLVVIPRAGHMVVQEQPQAVVEQLRRFLITIPYHPGQG